MSDTGVVGTQKKKKKRSNFHIKYLSTHISFSFLQWNEVSWKRKKYYSVSGDDWCKNIKMQENDKKFVLFIANEKPCKWKIMFFLMLTKRKMFVFSKKYFLRFFFWYGLNLYYSIQFTLIYVYYGYLDKIRTITSYQRWVHDNKQQQQHKNIYMYKFCCLYLYM